MVGVCYDGVEGLLYLCLFSILAACAFTVMLCAIPRAWRQIACRSAAPCVLKCSWLFQVLKNFIKTLLKGNEITMTLMKRTRSTLGQGEWAPRTPTIPTCTASAATAAAWAARTACTRLLPPSPPPPCLNTCEWNAHVSHLLTIPKAPDPVRSESPCRNQAALFGGNPRYENVPLIGRGSPPPSVRWVPEPKPFS